MKHLKLWGFLAIAIVMSNCSKEDDGASQMTNQQLLVSGKWYQESKTTGTVSACDKKSYIEFMSNGTMSAATFEDSSGSCTSSGINSATYTLTNNVNIKITFGTDVIDAVIKSITATKLTIDTQDNGQPSTQVFDKTEG